MFKKVLVSTDGSAFAEEGVKVAVDLARQCGGELRAVSVAENPVFYGTPEATAMYDADLYRALSSEVERLCQAALARAMDAARKAGVPFSESLRHGNPADEIVAEADAWKADVIVLATHGRSGLVRLLLGSVAHRVVNHAACPVLLHRVGNGG
jgi:nucleotide-binding universal stress UspA family protein